MEDTESPEYTAAVLAAAASFDHTALQESNQDRDYLRGRVDELAGEITATNSSLGLVTTQRDSLVDRLSEVERLHRAAAVSLRDRTVERDSLSQQLGEVSVKAADWEERSRILSSQLEGVKVERDHAQTASDSLTAERDDLRTRYDDLMGRFDARGTRLQDARNERDRLETRLQAKASDLEAFRERVVAVASEAAEEHGWCDTIDQILGELGLERKPWGYTGDLTITVQFQTQLTSRRDLPDENWVLNSMNEDAIRRAIYSNFGMDSDHRSSSVNDVSFEVSNVERLDSDD
jgi:uncharacterized coiled-coil DUF342 family protein